MYQNIALCARFSSPLSQVFEGSNKWPWQRPNTFFCIFIISLKYLKLLLLIFCSLNCMTNCKTDNLGQGHEPCYCEEGGHQVLTPWTSVHFSGSVVKLCIPSFLNFNNEAGCDVFWDQKDTLLWRFQKNAPLLTPPHCFDLESLIFAN